MTGEAARAVYEPGWSGAQVIRATLGEHCPKCGSILDIDGPHQAGPHEAVWFASCSAGSIFYAADGRCDWLCDQSLGHVPWDWYAQPGTDTLVTA